MKRTIIIKSLSAEVMRRIRHFGDFVTVSLASVIFIVSAGVDRLYLVLAGLAAWTLLEYLVHRFVFHRYSSVGRRLHQLHHDHPNDPDAERSSLSTPLIAFPIRISADCHCGDGRWLGDFRRTSFGVSGFHHCPLCGAPLADRAKLLALSSKAAAPHPPSPRELQFRRDDEFLGHGFSHLCRDHRRTPPFRGWMKGFDFGHHV